MTRVLIAFTTAVALLLGGIVLAEATVIQRELTPDEKPTRYTERAPVEGTPQAAMVNLVLLTEAGRISEAQKFISRTCPDWLREAMLKSNGPISQDTLSYQLREFTPGRALVSVDYNEPDGTFHGWTRSVIFEDGRWVVR